MKEDKSPIGVANVETTYFDNCAFFVAFRIGNTNIPYF